MSPVLKSGDVRTKLESKFGFTRTGRADHPEYELVAGGRVLATTHVSHKKRNEDIGVSLQALMARQLGVTTPQFRAMIQCTLTRDQYVSLLSEPGK